MAKDGIHLVPVFQKDLPAVWKLLSELNPDAQHGSTAAANSTPEASWSDADLVALFGLCKPVHRAILTRIAEAGEKQKPATYEELRAAGAHASKNPAFNFDNMRGNLAWISKYIIKVKGSLVGPFTFSDQGPSRQTGERYEYLMTQRIATAWLGISRTS